MHHPENLFFVWQKNMSYALSLHLNAVIKDFCKQLGADNKQAQGLIRLAKKNGEKLGFLA